MAVQPIPEGFHTLTPYLVVSGVAKLIDFLKKAFDAVEVHRTARPDGTVMHAELKIGSSILMMGEACGQWPAMPASLYMYVKNADAVYRQALAAGGVSIMEPANQFYGDRHGGVKDPSGNMWWIATHIEDVPPDELARRASEYMKKQAPS